MSSLFSEKKTYRNLCFTLNNYSEEEYNKLFNMNGVKYIVIGKEVGEEKTPHLQGYVEFTNSKKGSTLKKFNARIHWEGRKGTAKQAADYCKKEGDWREEGEISAQGCGDLKGMVAAVASGERSVNEILMEDPNAFHTYGRTLQKADDVRLTSVQRTEMTKGFWYWGSTGTGKSHRAFTEAAALGSVYVWSNDINGWWDNYEGQTSVVINDFRGEIKYNTLLQMVDKWPFHVSRRGRPPMPFTSKFVFITSSLEPAKVFKHRNEEDNIAQLLRRFAVDHMAVRYIEEEKKEEEIMRDPEVGPIPVDAGAYQPYDNVDHLYDDSELMHFEFPN